MADQIPGITSLDTTPPSSAVIMDGANQEQNDNNGENAKSDADTRRGTDLTQVAAVRDGAIRTELPPLVRPRLEKELTDAVERHFNGPHRNMSIQGKVLRRYSTLEEAMVYAVDAPRCGGVTLSGFKRYECREGRMYKQQLDESVWIKLPSEAPLPLA